MKFITLTLALAVVNADFLADVEQLNLKEKFAAWKVHYNKSYETEAEEAKRFEVFKDTFEFVTRRREEGAMTLGLTKFADVSPKEFSARYLNYIPVRGNKELVADVTIPSGASTPTSKDWRDDGAVTDVKDQGYCGSCWAFSATEEIESMWALAGNDLTEFSVEQIVQCDSDDAGCNGGDTITAYEYVEDAGGMATDEDYPYSTSTYYGTTGSCQDFTVSGGEISGYTYATPGCTSRKCDDQDEDTLIANLGETGPASICVDASEWSSYNGDGVFDGSCSSGYYSLDHCVQLVGYHDYSGDADDSSDGYYLVRNSWGTDWGVDGYIYLEMGSNACGVATEANFVTIA